MSLNNHGITDEAMEYIYKHSNFISYNSTGVQPIGCKQSDGYANVNAMLYDKKDIDGTVLFLFKYYLENNVVAKEVVQEIKGKNLFICLEINGRKKFKWKKEEQNA